MRYVEGTDLSRGIEAAREALAEVVAVSSTRGPAPHPGEPGRAREVCLLRARGPSPPAAHDEGLVHRDIKPANLMVSPSGDPVVWTSASPGWRRLRETPDPALTQEEVRHPRLPGAGAAVERRGGVRRARRRLGPRREPARGPHRRAPLPGRASTAWPWRFSTRRFPTSSATRGDHGGSSHPRDGHGT